MAKDFQGFALRHTTEVVTSNPKDVSSHCMSIDFENTGDNTAYVQIKGQTNDVKFALSKGDSISFPSNGNANPLVIVEDTFTITFQVGAGASKLQVTKAYANPKVLTF